AAAAGVGGRARGGRRQDRGGARGAGPAGPARRRADGVDPFADARRAHARATSVGGVPGPRRAGGGPLRGREAGGTSAGRGGRVGCAGRPRATWASTSTR